MNPSKLPTVGLPWTLNVPGPPKDPREVLGGEASKAVSALAWGARKHEWNRSFDWTPARPPYRLLSDRQAEVWNENGFLLVENAFDPETLRELVDRIDPLERQAEEYLRDHLGGKAFIARAGEITFTNHLAVKSAEIRELILNETVVDLCHDLVGGDCRAYWDMSVYKKPGTIKPFPWHQDNGYTFVEPQQYVTFWIALTDATLTNGCPWVLPRWHRQGTLAHRITPLGFTCFEEEPEFAIPVPAPAGSIVVLSSLTPHTTGSNLTPDTRKAYILEVAPEGAETLRREKDGSIHRTACTNPRQFPILVGGKRAAAC
jgi:ectoine hydroxylase-related dioxygenase (phytanoyl-CoA dioxygenase family)